MIAYLAYELLGSFECYIWRFVTIDYLGLGTINNHFGNTRNIYLIQIPSIDTRRVEGNRRIKVN